LKNNEGFYIFMYGQRPNRAGLPVPVRSPKSSNSGSGQCLDGWPLQYPRWCCLCGVHPASWGQLGSYLNKEVAITVESFGSPLPTRLVSVGAVDHHLPPGEASSSSGLNMAVYYYYYMYIYLVQRKAPLRPAPQHAVCGRMPLFTVW